MPLPKAVCVYCGANAGARRDYASLARALGTELAQRGITLVYGGGKVGLMGVVADAALAAGGRVTGVITNQLAKLEMAHPSVRDMQVVPTMDARKARMSELAEGYVALPGGFGTMDEIFEMMTLAQLGLHPHPCAFLDTCGYYDALRQMVAHMAEERFLSPNQRDSVWFGQSIPALFDWMEHYDARGALRLAARVPATT